MMKAKEANPKKTTEIPSAEISQPLPALIAEKPTMNSTPSLQ
jgi:hypothetical protein